MAGVGFRSRWIDRATLFLGLVAGLNTLVMVLVYAAYPGYLDTNESGLVAMSRLMLSGEPVYRSLRSPDVISHLHGPFTFLWTALPLMLPVKSVMAARLGATLAALLLPLVMMLSQRRHGPWAMLVALGMGALAIVLHTNMSIVVRPDTPQTVMVALAVWVVAWGERRQDKGGWLPSVLLGLCCGVVAGFKVSAVVAVAPVALYYCLGDWRRRFVVVGAVAAAVAVAPFLTTTFPLVEYREILASATGKEAHWRGFVALWWKFAIYLAVPPVLWLAAGRPGLAVLRGRLGVYLAAYVAGVLLMLYPAIMPGAGNYYFLPFMPVLVDLSLRAVAAGGARRERLRALMLVTLALCLGAAWQHDRRFYKTLEWEEARGATDEIHAILAAHPGQTVQMGVGGVKVGDPLNYRFYAYRDLLVMAGQPYTMDINVVMELTKLNIPQPAAFVERLRTCHTKLWLVPHGEEPFSLWGYYFQYVFTPEFRKTFAETHVLAESRRYFDVWECRAAQ